MHYVIFVWKMDKVESQSSLSITVYDVERAAMQSILEVHVSTDERNVLVFLC